MYGLKQASRAWNEKLNSVLMGSGLKRCESDPCMYYFIDGETIMLLAVYVDDILIISNNFELEQQLVGQLRSIFKMKDLGEATSVLGVKISRDLRKSTIAIDQQHYIVKMLERFGMTDCNPISTPLDPNQHLTKEMGPTSNEEIEDMKAFPYQEAIGSMMYAAQLTRPDICFALTLLSRFNKNPGHAHWQAVKRVFRYLKGTINRKLVFRGNADSELIGYCDADHAGNQDSRRSTSGYVFAMCGAAISWCSKGQKTVSLSTTESEYTALVLGMQEAIWLKRFECEIFANAPKCITIHCDNKGALFLAINNSTSPRTKHMDIKAKFVREQLDCGRIKLEYISTNDMLADIFTKAMTSDKQTKFTSLLGLKLV